MRRWVGIHAVDTDPAILIRDLYDGIYTFAKKDSIPRAILILAECQYRLASVTDSEIQLVASFTEMMMEIEWA